MIDIREFTEQDAKTICIWAYDGEYALYNYPDWATALADNWAITDETKRKTQFKSVYNENNELIGFYRLFDKEDSVIIGIGVKPDVCGLGYGKQIMQHIAHEHMKNSPHKKLDLEVRTFNKRAIACYTKAGFVAIDTVILQTHIGTGEFYLMRYKETM